MNRIFIAEKNPDLHPWSTCINIIDWPIICALIVQHFSSVSICEEMKDNQQNRMILSTQNHEDKFALNWCLTSFRSEATNRSSPMPVTLSLQPRLQIVMTCPREKEDRAQRQKVQRQAFRQNKRFGITREERWLPWKQERVINNVLFTGAAHPQDELFSHYNKQFESSVIKTPLSPLLTSRKSIPPSLPL